ncbi:tRNA (adenosine(37)-N6)-threonylcarbamoyltransferase complex dimerization subunit type 1 TsaB [Neptuniibacter sp. CAU 1671]|uniref:tRNA (adenosine(37)-N6)-threonylcarbamoyltransferase complex dimerization subunit type 1 TsaB n=1 Tax=Neptuniibacter sp. CAU 1671 TaxID=3032593 RepID=UPI0023DA57ED|nr:tRNA (adenosine(37)-N6)-threonylcarbamoyltransferase complex dimerization subunit type 1 TsaB [Neptuniibacter sp. CAU 1671]MDF2182234.1 tRNA (adenosine(37)-N6)-threonylcarbamoyltransferase complex dimerization subunit type 1 TsaB [Neptuniibacter sp. CAU 1671]
MAKILALDTSTDACSVALHLDGEVMQDFRVIPRQHTQQLLPMVEAMLAEAGLSVQQLDAIAFGRGPGSFAGIRIATGVTQGLAFAADLPVLPVSTLASLALSAWLEEGADNVVAALDARMDEIYVAAYRIDQGLPVEVMPEKVCPPSLLTLPEMRSPLAVGSGWCYLNSMSSEVQQQVRVSTRTYYPNAAVMLTLALSDWAQSKAVTAEQALPVYLRDEVAWKKLDQQ